MKKGELVKPDVCELCGYDSTRRNDTTYTHSFQNPRIVAHHWRGYEYPLDVWWICASCNRKLTGRHDGTLSKEQAREIIGQYRPPSQQEATFWQTVELAQEKLRAQVTPYLERIARTRKDKNQ